MTLDLGPSGLSPLSGTSCHLHLAEDRENSLCMLVA